MLSPSHRSARLALLLGFLSMGSPGVATSLARSDPDSRVTLRIRYEWKARLVSRGEFADVTTIHHVAEATCPLFASHVDGIPVLQAPSAEQTTASQAAADAATRQVTAVPSPSATAQAAGGPDRTADSSTRESVR